MDSVAAVDVAVVIPNYNGARWLPGVLESVAAQTLAPAAVLVVDDGSSDGSLALLAERFPDVRVLALERNGGFARTANAGLRAVTADAVALVNTDVVLAPDWLERAAAALGAAPRAAAVATKLVDLADPALLYDAGDVLRRDGACEQRGRFERDAGRYDAPGEVFSACAGAALYRRAAVLGAGGFDERFGTYLEDVDLGLRLRIGRLALPLGAARGRAPRRRRLERGAAPRAGRVGGAQHAAARRPRVPGALAAPGRVPPARLGVARGPRRRAARPPRGRADGAAAAARVPARAAGAAARRGGAGRGGGAAAADPRAARGWASVAACAVRAGASRTAGR